jgi:ATP-binding cassette subfamily B protein
MDPAAYQRARKLLGSDSGAVLAARVLGVLDALLLIGLVIAGGLLLALIDSRGITELGPSQLTVGRVQSMPRWVFNRLPLIPSSPARGRRSDRPAVVRLPDTGLYPLIAGNLGSPNPAHRFGARTLDQFLRRYWPARTNLGALNTLLIVGLLQLLMWCYVNQFRRALLSRAAVGVAATLRHQVHRQMYRLGQSALPTEGVGPVVHLFTRDVNDVRDGLIAGLDATYRLPVLGVGLLLIALFLSLKLTVFLLSLGGLVWLISRPLSHGANVEADAAARDAAVQLSLLHEDLAMLRTVRVYGAEAIVKQRFDEHLERHREADYRRLTTEGRRNPTTLLLVGAAGFLAAGMIGYSVLEDRPGRINLATGLLLIGSLLALAWPIAGWFDLRRAIRQAGRSAGGIFNFLERKPELQQSVGAQFLAPLKERISLENVNLDGPTGRTLLAGVTAEIPARTKTAIMGSDEEAKHALACLIPRLIDPKVGRVRMDGLDLREVTLESLRAQVALVLQHDLIYTDTVTANIGLNDPSFGLPRIIEAAKIAHAHHFIQELPHGYETIIGPLGHYLRPDEQYRIALARAFLHDPSLVVIEEPTTPLDDDTKHLIDDTIDRFSPGRTFIFLPHRLSTIRKCNQVIVLHNGRVEAIGPPRDVHGQSKLYRHLQYVEFNQFATGEIEAGQMG